MSLIELLFIIVCASVLIIGITYALQDIKACEKEIGRESCRERV